MCVCVYACVPAQSYFARSEIQGKGNGKVFTRTLGGMDGGFLLRLILFPLLLVLASAGVVVAGSAFETVEKAAGGLVRASSVHAWGA